MDAPFIQEAIFNQVGRDYNDNRTTKIKIFSGTTRDPLGRLEQNISSGAAHDSAERGPDAPKCHPETRTAVQEEILGWVERGNQDANPKRILWLSGPAGAGKTAIAGSVADACQAKGWLAATFFFSAFAGNPDRRSKQPLIPTLAYHLLHQESIPGLNDHILSSIAANPSIFQKRLDKQLDILLLNPLRKLDVGTDRSRWPKVIIIDGLDECDADLDKKFDTEQERQRCKEDNHKEILSTLARASSDASFPFRILVVSRPERAISDFFSTSPDLTVRLFLDDKYDPDSDIALFLEAKLAAIRRRFNLPASWASDNVVELLVKAASGQFIYVATAIRFVENASRPPPEQLERVLNWQSFDDSRPFAALDALYNGILHTSPNPSLASNWLRAIDDLRSYPDWPDAFIKALLESGPGETEYLLGGLTSLIGLSNCHGETVFHFYHKSLIDFLEDASRSTNLHVTGEDINRFIDDRFYWTLKMGPQGGSLQISAQSEFFGRFCYHLHHFITQCRKYEPADVDWWLAHLPSLQKDWYLSFMFGRIHRNCRWYRCLPACKVWRKGILQYCGANGWLLPTRMELIRDRLKKYEYNSRQLDAFPLRPPRSEDSDSNSTGDGRSTYSGG